MTHVTFLIGNGFDRQLGLDTDYNQFLNWYIKRPSANDNIAEYKAYLEKDRASAWWSDAEAAMGAYVGEFDSASMDAYFARIRDFKIELAEYLRQQEARCDFSDSQAAAEGFRDFLLNYHKDILLNKQQHLFYLNQDIRFDFVCFNYTRTLPTLAALTEKVFPVLSSTKLPNYTYDRKIGRCVAVHGSLDTSMIMGVNDVSQLSVPPERVTARLRRTLVKPETNSALGRAEDYSAEQLIKGSAVIAVYGLSLGDSDKKWRALLGDWLRQGGCIVIFGHKKLEGINTLIPEDTLDYVDSAQTAFLRKLFPDMDEAEADILRDKVLVVDRTSYLDLGLVADRTPATV